MNSKTLQLLDEKLEYWETEFERDYIDSTQVKQLMKNMLNEAVEETVDEMAAR